MNGGLFLLALRRALPRGLVLLACVAFLFAARHDWGSTRLVGGDGIDAALGSAFTRQGVWILFGVLVLSALLLRAGATIPTWRRADSDWLAPRATRRLPILVSTLLGLWAGGALLLVVAGLTAELAAGAGGAARRLAGTLEHRSLVILDEPTVARRRVTSRFDPERPGTRLRFHPTVGPGHGQGADIVLSVLTSDGSGGKLGLGRIERRISGRTAIEVPLAPGPAPVVGPIWIEVARPDPGTAVIVPADSTEVVVPAASARLATLEVGLRTLALLGAWIGLALGLGAWMSGPIASLLVSCAWLLPWLWNVGTTWFPGGDLFEALTAVGDGLVPPPPDPASFAGLVVALALGLALALGGLADWRTPP